MAGADRGVHPVEINEWFQGRLDRERDQRAALRAYTNVEDVHEKGNPEPDLLPVVEILGVRGLCEAAWAGFGRSQRFCQCEVPGKPSSEVRTPALEDTAKPQWSYRAEIPDFDFGDSLSFQVIAIHPKYKKWRACLGMASLASHAFCMGKEFDGELQLSDADGVRGEAFLHVKVSMPDPLEVASASLAAPPAKAEDAKPQPQPKRRQRPDGPEQRPVVVPSILEECLQEAKAGAERRRGKDEDGVPTEETVKCIEDLPPGWEAAWDTVHERYYFYNHDLGISSWEWPKEKRKGSRRKGPQAGSGL